MESQTKERLTGALILVAALVVIVPEIFSGPPHKAADAGAPQAQSANAGPPLRSYKMELGAGKAGGDQSALTPESQNDAHDAAEVATVTAASDAAPAKAVTPSPAVTSVPVAKTAPAPASTAVPEQPVSAAATPIKGAGWWVQLGSFSQRDNAQRLVQDLKAKGIPTQLTGMSAKGKELFRVRAGPVADRAAAQALQSRLAATGHRGPLVAP